MNRCLLHALLVTELVLSVASTDLASGQGCPPGTFDYSGACDPQTQAIVMDHDGAAGPLLPEEADCKRVAADQTAIRLLMPELVAVGHYMLWEPDNLIVQFTTPDDPDLLCLNLYFDAYMQPVPPPHTWTQIYFPQLLNLLAAGAMYEALPAVIHAGPNVYGCAGTCPLRTRWLYTPMADGVWHWRVLAPGPQGWGEVYHRLYVTEGGAATLAGAGDATGDGLVDVNDLLAVIGAWGPCAWPASSCPSDIAFDYSFTVDMADLLEVIDQWR